MLMILPVLTPSNVDCTFLYGVRQIFSIGRSNCNPPPLGVQEMVLETIKDTPSTYFCDPNQTPYVTTQGWFELLRNFVDSSA